MAERYRLEQSESIAGKREKMTMEMYIIRHGLTDWNKNGRLQGRVDTSLNDEGRAQAEAARQRFEELGVKFDRVYTSHLQRAMDTASIVSGRGKGDMILDDRIIEIDYGQMDGLSFDEVTDEMREFFIHPDTVLPPEGVETMEHMTARTAAFLHDVRKWSRRQTVLVVSHAIVIRAIFAALKGLEKPDAEIWRSRVGNCEIYHVSMEDGVYGDVEKI